MQDPRCSLDRIPKGDASSSYLRTLGIILRHVSNQLVVQEETVVTDMINSITRWVLKGVCRVSGSLLFIKLTTFSCFLSLFSFQLLI